MNRQVILNEEYYDSILNTIHDIKIDLNKIEDNYYKNEVRRNLEYIESLLKE